MDGLNYTAPYSETEQEEDSQLAFSGFEEEVIIKKYDVPCLIKDWTSTKPFEFKSLVKKG